MSKFYVRCAIIFPMVGFAVSVSFENDASTTFFLGMLVMLEIFLALSLFIKE